MTAPTARAIGAWGTTARIVLGLVLVGSVLYGHWARGWHPAAWLLGLVALPAVVLGGQWWGPRREPGCVSGVVPDLVVRPGGGRAQRRGADLLRRLDAARGGSRLRRL